MGNQISRSKVGQGLTVVGILAALAVCLLSSCTLLSTISSTLQTSPHLLLGKPSNATAFNAKDYLIVRPQYALSYHRDHGIPNWVSWQLNQNWLGDLPRLPFQPDSSLPQGWYQVPPAAYTGSGFDRGHMVPAADRNQTTADSQAVFLMTNILPQAPDNNQGPWEKLESSCRQLVRSGKELYIIAGAAGVGGTGTLGKATAIGRGKVLVPAVLWKIVVVLDRVGLPLESITSQTPVIAVIMPNQQGIKNSSWQSYQTSVDAIEQLTGYDFLSAVDPTIQAVLEAEAPSTTPKPQVKTRSPAPVVLKTQASKTQTSRTQVSSGWGPAELDNPMLAVELVKAGSQGSLTESTLESTLSGSLEPSSCVNGAIANVQTCQSPRTGTPSR